MTKRFEWDNRKAAGNLRKHGISFAEAADALDNGHPIDNLDDRFEYGEDRMRAVAMGLYGLLAVVYVEKEDVIRIISARRADRHEQDDYYRQNST